MRISFLTLDGHERTVEVNSGGSLMEAALRHQIKGIDAECGGARSCATCHVYVAPDWINRTGPAARDEADMLEALEQVKPNSRLSCQIKLTEMLDGLVVTIPASQQ
jgi:2Fe-2S ferredoxin